MQNKLYSRNIILDKDNILPTVNSCYTLISVRFKTKLMTFVFLLEIYCVSKNYMYFESIYLLNCPPPATQNNITVMK